MIGLAVLCVAIVMLTAALSWAVVITCNTIGATVDIALGLLIFFGGLPIAVRVGLQGAQRSRPRCDPARVRQLEREMGLTSMELGPLFTTAPVDEWARDEKGYLISAGLGVQADMEAMRQRNAAQDHA